MAKMQLFPFTINQIVDQAEETPNGVEVIQAPKVWDASSRGAGIVVAVIDTGVQSDHPDLKERIVGGYNFTDDYDGDTANFEDNNGHGTHVAGTIAAAENTEGVIGVAPEAGILALKVLDSEGSGAYEWIINGIQYAIDWRGPNQERVRVISMSLGGPEDVPELHEVVRRAVAADISVVVAAGNSGDGRDDTVEQDYPGNYNEVISVGAIDQNLSIAPFSNSNYEIDLVAPGVEVISTYLDGQYAALSGTSMATPHVAGAIALLINSCEQAFSRHLIEVEIYAQLIKRTLPLGHSKTEEGNGLITLDLVDRIQDVIRTTNLSYQLKYTE